MLTGWVVVHESPSPCGTGPTSRPGESTWALAVVLVLVPVMSLLPVPSPFPVLSCSGGCVHARDRNPTRGAHPSLHRGWGQLPAWRLLMPPARGSPRLRSCRGVPEPRLGRLGLLWPRGSGRRELCCAHGRSTANAKGFSPAELASGREHPRSHRRVVPFLRRGHDNRAAS